MRGVAAAALLALGTACGSSGQGGGTTPDGHAYAEPDVVSDANAIGSDADAASSGGDAGASSSCEAGVDGGALAAPEVVADHVSWLVHVGASSQGPIWLVDCMADTWLGCDPSSDPLSPEVFIGAGAGAPVWSAPYGEVDDSHVSWASANGWFTFLFRPLLNDPDHLVLGSVDGGVQDCHPFWRDCGQALGESHLYVLASDAFCMGAGHYWIARVPLGPSSCSTSGTTVQDLGNVWAIGIAVDQSQAYSYVPDELQPDTYSIRAGPKSGGSPSVMASGTDPELTGWPYPITFLARAGTLAWAHPGKSTGAHNMAHYISVLSGDGPVRTLVDEPDGIVAGQKVAMALDDRYVYWATVTGFVKRIRLCGGTPEILAANQDKPVDIAVDDFGIYWIDQGTDPSNGKVMRIRKLDAADAGPDAASDAGSDASLDAAPDTSVDGGAGVDSGVGDSGGG